MKQQLRRTAPLVAAVLLAGCHATVDGHPRAVPGGGTGSTSPATPSTAPSRTTPPSTTTQTPTPGKPGQAEQLPANADGYVFIETKSGRTRCQISLERVGCEAAFTNSPIKDGEHANGVSISSDGTVQWVLGNLGNIPVVTIDYLTYQAQGWTIKATIDGTRFTNTHTGHGMFVSIDKVETF